MALDVFRKATAKLESSRGAGGTPTRILSFTDGSHSQTIEVVRPDELRASYFPVYSAVAGTERNELNLSGRLDFSQAAWLGYMFVSGAPTLGTPVAGTAYSFAFLPSGSADDVKSAVFEFGYADSVASTAAAKLTYAMGNELTLRFDKPSSEITYDASFMSASTATRLTAFTGSPTSPTTTLLSTNTTQVYIDTGTIGSTVDNQVISAEWQLSLSPTPLYTLNGSTGAQAMYRPSFRTWSLTLNRYFADASQWTAYSSQSVQKVRIATTGAALGTATYSLTLDLYATVTGREVSSTDGLGVEQLTLSPIFDSSLGSDFKLTVTSADASIT